MLLWHWRHTCPLDALLYTFALVLINCAHSIYLVWRHFPAFIPGHQRELFAKVFKPLHVSKKVSFSRHRTEVADQSLPVAAVFSQLDTRRHLANGQSGPSVGQRGPRARFVRGTTRRLS